MPTLAALALALLAPSAAHAVAQEVEPTLETLLADPRWIGRGPSRPFWAGPDTIGFWREREEDDLEDLWAVDARGGEPAPVEPGAWRALWRDGGDWSPDGARYVYADAGDLFVAELGGDPAPRQLLRTQERESSPRFLADGRRVAFERGSRTFVLDLGTGFLDEPFELVLEEDPEEEEDYAYLRAKHERLYEKLAEEAAQEARRRARERQLAAADPTRPPTPYHLGEGVEVVERSLAPGGAHVLVVLRDERGPGERGTMPSYVTASGEVETRAVRPRVGNAPAGQRLLLLDLGTRARHDLPLDGLPGIGEDPLAGLREEALAWHVAHGAEEAALEKQLEAPAERPVQLRGVRWSPAGARALVRLDSVDNKDTWYATLDLADEPPALRPLHRVHDDAWINDGVRSFGWLDEETVWYLSEETGHAHLFARGLDGGSRALTAGPWVVRRPVLSRARDAFTFLANEGDPSVWDVQRVEVASGERRRLTEGGGVDAFGVSPDERRVWTLRSRLDRPEELYVQAAEPGAEARRLTRTTSPAFDAIGWTVPELVDVPSSHGTRPIRGRLYRPVAASPLPDGRSPAVVFVHGAGYLQNAKASWSGYFREFFFHTFLTRRGFVVLDLDYRGSAGYGRDWRTAIYRRMGHPELEDLVDGVAWLVREEGVHPERVGVYGGSYGGFLTFMALFREPRLFAAGAALRPVTDWAHYNHGYTSNILNTPLVDPMAFEASSPVEYAAGLERPLLIASGMQDDNVFFQDTVLLVQRLLELEKQGFETALYPLDPHAFRHAESWLDEYRRIWALFERHLLP